MIHPDTLPARGVITDADIDDLRRRDEQRLALAKARLGRAYLLHPSNRVSRWDAPAPQRTATVVRLPARPQLHLEGVA